ncbi:MAG TPA: alpha/beta fold hydrolase, partial [Candidatus Nitrosotenuis sp.]|nr:alpha/beta fold hydrolase [Candidatus Nitrosotenuis sp.]
MRIAYAVVGQGIPLVKAANWLNHLEFDWKSPLWRPLLEDLARDFSLVRYDERGNGLSDWDATNLSFDSFVSDLESVVEAAGLERFALLGISQGGPVSIAYAVKHPERVSHLILYGAYACGWRVRANPEEIRLRTAMLQLVEQGWGKENPAFRQIWTSFYIPGGTPEQMQWFNELQRVTTSPQNAIRLLTEFGNIDVRPLLSQVKVPTLVLHCQDDAAVPLESGRLIAAGIPGARFVTLPGKNHVPLPQDEAWHLMSAEIRRFLGVPERPVAVARPGADSAATQIAPGAMVNQYRVGARLGAGGMGEVFRARDERLQRDVALKVLRVPAEKESSARRRLLEEARAAAALAHPNICVVYEVGEAHDEMYIAMELVPGQPLAEAARSGALPPSRIAQIGAQLADALDHAHNNGVVHRDLKPGNVVVTPEGRAKILDFGLAVRDSADWAEATKSSASLADSRAIAGTLPYMAPEVLRGQPADARSDIWSLGVLLYELACGQPPFRGASGFELTSSILRDPLPGLPEPIPPGLAAVIRRCLEKDPAQRYQRAGEIRAALETISAPPVPARETSAARTLPASADETTAAPRKFFLRRGIVGVAGFGILLLVLAFFPGVRKRIFSERTAAPRIESLAVLPLDNMTGDPAQEYFADGMTEALITELSKISALKVISRTSVMQYKGTKIAMPQVARDLGVDALIEGSVRRDGDQVRITVQLIHGATDRHLWARTFDRELRNILALHSEVAQLIAGEIRVALTPRERAMAARVRTIQPEAYEAYLRGRYHWNQRTPDGFQKAGGYFQRALDLHPTYALAYAGMADNYIQQVVWGILPPDDGYPRAKAAATRALQLDDTLAEPYATLGFMLSDFDWDWPGAEQAFRRALELNPNYPTAHHWFAFYLSTVRRHEAAITEIRRAQELDPLSVIINSNVGRIHYYARRYYDAERAAQNALQMDANFAETHAILGLIYLATGRAAEAVASLRRAVELFRARPEYRSALAEAYILTGSAHDARRLLVQLEKDVQKQYVPAGQIALV